MDKKAINEKRFQMVKEYLEAKGVNRYSLYEGNDCVWASYGRSINAYFIFNSENTKIVDIQVD